MEGGNGLYPLGNEETINLSAPMHTKCYYMYELPLRPSLGQ
jgi:hypothetical protein